MLLPAFPTESDIDAAYPVLGNPDDCATFAAVQRAACLNRVIELLSLIPLTALERELVHRASDQALRIALVETAGVRH